MLRKVWLICLACLLLCACGDVEVAKGYARSYASDLGYSVIGVACTGTDSDGDGYISCTVRVKDDEPLILQCASGSAASFTAGCKAVQTFKVKGGAAFAPAVTQ